MTVYAHMADLYGCGWHRIGYIAGVLQAQGHDVRVITPGQPSAIKGVLHGDTVVDARVPQDADVVVIQRPCNRKLAEAIPFLRARGVAVVVDMDDDLGHIHPRNPAFEVHHPKTSPDGNWQHAALACRSATLVTVSTPALAQTYGSHGRVRVLENCVPAAFLEHERVDSEWVGWPGSLHSHPDDLKDAAGAIQRLVRDDGAQFRVVGDGVGVGKLIGLPDDAVLASGDIAFDQWSAAVAQVGIGIAPLADTRFNRAKSWLKPLTFAALGVPFVASGISEYARFCAMGAGRAVPRRGWHGALRALLASPAEREHQSGVGREIARDYTYEGRAWMWAEAWTDAAKMERA